MVPFAASCLTNGVCCMSVDILECCRCVSWYNDVSFGSAEIGEIMVRIEFYP